MTWLWMKLNFTDLIQMIPSEIFKKRHTSEKTDTNTELKEKLGPKEKEN